MLQEKAATSRFSDRASDYARARPGYPLEAIDAILEGLGPPVEQRAADVGAGTGISARLLAERGVRVLAVEPNPAMRSAGASCSARGPAGVTKPRAATEGAARGEIKWLSGTAEGTGLPDACVNLVLCAQSYHWFDPVAACQEFGRILRPGGRLALMWNDGDESTPVARRYYELVHEASGGVGSRSHQVVAQDPRLEPPFDRSPLRRLCLCHGHRLDESGLIARAMSASYVPREGEAAKRLVDGLLRLHSEHRELDGRVEMVYQVWVYMSDRPRLDGVPV